MQKLKDKIKNEPIIFLFRKMWRFAGGYKKYIVLAIMLEILAQLVVLTEPIVFASLIKEIEVYGATRMNEIYKIFGIFALVSIGFFALHGPARILMTKVVFYTKLSYAKYMLGGVFNLPMSWHNDRDSGDTIDKINKGKGAIDGATVAVIDYVRMAVRLIGTVIILFWFNIYVALFALIITVVAMLHLLWFNKFLIPLQKKLNKYDNKISAGIFDSLSNVTSVIILQIIQPVLRRVIKQMKMPYKTFMKSAVFSQIKWFTGEVWFAILVIIPMVLYIVYVNKYSLALEVSIITAMFMYLTRMSNVFFNFAYYYEGTIRQKVDMQNAEEIEEAIEENKTLQKKKTKIADWSTMQIENLNFSYAGSKVKHEDLHLNNVNLSINKGERIAFIGESGSGKTTFLKVLHGLYNSASANVSFIDNVRRPTSHKTNFVDIDLATMLVPQEPEIFSSTIKENITLGLPTKKEEIERVLKLARFEDVVNKLPKGLKSVINEKGVNLSGGQKQRLALARALLFAQDKQILLLDESTSSVDPENEAHIYEDIFKMYKGKTILASIHKMNLLKYFDRIVMFENGKLVDEGTFDELLKKNKKFKKDWDEFVKSGV